MIGKRVKVSTKGDFSVIPMDKYTCQITDVVEKTRTFNEAEGPKDGFNYEFSILNQDKPDDDGNSLYQRKLWYWVSTTISGRSHLGKLINAAYGVELSKEELKEIEEKGFDADGLVGCQIDVLVENNEGKGNNAGTVFSNVASVYKTTRPLPGLEGIPTSSPSIQQAAPAAPAPQAAPVAANANPKSAEEFEAGLKEDSQLTVAEWQAKYGKNPDGSPLMGKTTEQMTQQELDAAVK